MVKKLGARSKMALFDDLFSKLQFTQFNQPEECYNANQVHQLVYLDFIDVNDLPVEVPLPIGCKFAKGRWWYISEKHRQEKLKLNDFTEDHGLSIGRAVGRIVFRLGFDCNGVEFVPLSDGSVSCSRFEGMSLVNLQDPRFVWKVVSNLAMVQGSFVPLTGSSAWLGFCTGLKWEAGTTNSEAAAAIIRSLEIRALKKKQLEDEPRRCIR